MDDTRPVIVGNRALVAAMQRALAPYYAHKETLMETTMTKPEETRARVQILIDDAQIELAEAMEAQAAAERTATRWLKRVAALREWASRLDGSTFDTVPPAE
jgi:hypothetical protein